MHRIFECERTLELSCLHLERFKFLPLGECVNHTWRRSEVACIAIGLELDFPVEVLHQSALKSHTHHTDVEGVDVLGAIIGFLVAVLILRHYIAAELDVADNRNLRLALLSQRARCGKRSKSER